MGTREVLAVSRGLPVDDLLSGEESGPEAAARALFGCQPLEVPWAEVPRPQDRVQLGKLPLHAFAAVATSGAGEPPTRDSRRRILRRFLGPR